MTKAKTKLKAKFTPFEPETDLPSGRTYCGKNHHLRGTGAGSLEFGDNEKEITEDQRKGVWRLIDRFRVDGVATSEIVMVMLDCAVDLTATQLPCEGSAYTPFVEAMSDLFNHYAAMGVADAETIW